MVLNRPTRYPSVSVAKPTCPQPTLPRPGPFAFLSPPTPVCPVPDAPAPLDATDARLDKWLWCVRACKTRALAAEACKSGRVHIDGREAKPASTVRPGQLVEYRDGALTRRLRVLGAPRSRVAASALPPFVGDETPPEEIAAAREQRVQNLLAGGATRPDKHARRARQALRLVGIEPDSD